MHRVDQAAHASTIRRPPAVTSIADGRNHLISEDAPPTGQPPQRGQYVALCGHRVVAAPLVAPEGPLCLDCEAALYRSTGLAPTAAITCPGRAHRLVTRLRRSNFWA